MATYRFLAYDLMTNVLVAELPLTVRKYGGTFNGAGTFEADMNLDPATAATLLDATTEERRIIYVERNGVIVADSGYIIWDRTLAFEQPVHLVGASMFSLIKSNCIIADHVYTATTHDQLDIARGIIADVAAQPGGNFGIQTGSNVSGRKRDRTYNGYDFKNAGDALAELAACEDGFDFAFTTTTDTNGNPVRNLELNYPRRGRGAGSTGIIFETGKNLLDYTRVGRGSQSARAVNILGSGDGKDMKIGSSTDTSLIDAGYPMTRTVLSAKDVSVQQTLDDKALSERKARSRTPEFWTLVIDPNDPDAGLGTWIAGDDALIRITDKNYPLQADGSPGKEFYARILSWYDDAPDDGPEKIYLTVGALLA